VTGRRWAILRQTWANIVWCHWPVAPETLSALLPPGLTPDLFEGRAWVGLVPFSMENLRLAPPFGFVTRWLRAATFGEVNVRTYVRGPDGQSGVWFCTLDADSWWAVVTARVAFGLPYRVATTKWTQSTTLRWSARRRGDGARARLIVAVDDGPSRPASAGLEQFLVERYALYTRWGGLLLRGELHHEPWRVRSATLVDVTTETVATAGFSVAGAPHLLVGEPVAVSVYPMRPVGFSLASRDGRTSLRH